jgi:hypothetical protein
MSYYNIIHLHSTISKCIISCHNAAISCCYMTRKLSMSHSTYRTDMVVHHFLLDVYTWWWPNGVEIRRMVSTGMLCRVHPRRHHFSLSQPWKPHILHGVEIYCTETNKTNSVAFSLQANSTNSATASCWRNLMTTFVYRGMSLGQRGGSRAVVNLSFLDRSR